MTKVDLITGFLGAGKTTFIQKYADYLQKTGEKIHIIENDFSNMSLDAQILQGQELDVSALSGGCMCCTGRRQFQSMLVNAANAGYDRILVEPSGIYDVNSFFNIVTTSPVKEVCIPNTIITVVDAQPEGILSRDVQELMFSQLSYTGCVLVSKSQNCTQEEVDVTTENLQLMMQSFGSSCNLREQKLFITKPWDQLEEEDFARIAACGYELVNHTSTPMDHMSIFNMCMLAERFDTQKHLQEILNQLFHSGAYGNIYRVKGYIADTQKQMFLLNATPNSFTLTPSQVKRGIFCVIGQGFEESKIKALFSQMS